MTTMLEGGPPRYSTRSAAALRQRFLQPRRAGPGALRVSTSGLDVLVAFEIGSMAFYAARLTHPHWPGGVSGVTIGIGYDLGYQTRRRLHDDWSELLGEDATRRLAECVGATGKLASALCRTVADVLIPLDPAARVFYRSTLPRYADSTAATFPGVGQLPADATTMLLSLIYNRGPRLSGASRREMRDIRRQVPARDLCAIAASLRSMKRLWPDIAGLVRRREREAKIVESADRRYSGDEFVWL